MQFFVSWKLFEYAPAIFIFYIANFDWHFWLLCFLMSLQGFLKSMDAKFIFFKTILKRKYKRYGKLLKSLWGFGYEFTEKALSRKIFWYNIMIMQVVSCSQFLFFFHFSVIPETKCKKQGWEKITGLVIFIFFLQISGLFM